MKNLQQKIALVIGLLALIAVVIWVSPQTGLGPQDGDPVPPTQEEDYNREVSMIGTYTCLPHADTSGPQTLECAFGIQEESTGDYYALDTQFLDTNLFMTLATNTKVKVDGLLTPVEMLSSTSWQKYNIKGILSARTAVIVEEGI